MKIAQIAPLMESVPPRLYGGTERVVSYLCEALVELGHDVTLFASGDSVTSARLVACTKEAIRLNPAVQDHVPHYMIMLDKLRRSAHLFDILHFHIDAFHMPLFRDVGAKTLTTFTAARISLTCLSLYRAFPEMPLVSISNAQRQPIADANIAKTIYHGLPLDLLAPNYEPRGGYLAFLGRISPEKRPDRAIAIANALGLPLKIAAKVDKADEAYFRETVSPLLGRPGIEFVGEINDCDKERFPRRGSRVAVSSRLAGAIRTGHDRSHGVRDARSRISLRLAFRKSSTTGSRGGLVDTVDEAIRALPEVIRLDRRAVRRRFEERFSSRRMASDYLDVYRSVDRSTSA